MRPFSPALPLGRIATVSQAHNTVAFDLITIGVPRRSCRVRARTAREARILGAVALNVDLERVAIRPEPYSLTSRGLA